MKLEFLEFNYRDFDIELDHNFALIFCTDLEADSYSPPKYILWDQIELAPTTSQSEIEFIARIFVDREYEIQDCKTF